MIDRHKTKRIFVNRYYRSDYNSSKTRSLAVDIVRRDNKSFMEFRRESDTCYYMMLIYGYKACSLCPLHQMTISFARNVVDLECQSAYCDIDDIVE